MKEYYIDTHSSLCPCSTGKKQKGFRYCELNPVRFLFFLGNKFFLITYHPCLDYDKYDFRKSIIEKICKKYAIFERWDVNKGVNTDKDLKDFRIRNKELRKYIQQVNYLYYDATGKEYAITTLTNYIETICNQEIIKENFNKAKEFLQKKEYYLLIGELEKLYEVNILYHVSEAEYFKTTKHLIKSINKLTKMNYGNN